MLLASESRIITCTCLRKTRVLTEDEVASLAPGSRPLHPAPKAVQSEVGRIWPEAQLLASDDVRLPVFPPSTSLASYGIKERLVTRWRTVQGATAGAELASGCQAGLFALLSSQADILHLARPYPTSADPGTGRGLVPCLAVPGVHRPGPEGLVTYVSTAPRSLPLNRPRTCPVSACRDSSPLRDHHPSSPSIPSSPCSCAGPGAGRDPAAHPATLRLQHRPHPEEQ